ncbi:hypothetical protein L3Q82_024423 [Scortum barcoo]|uniref:Uncharacterized protein n=1 Tax=Scortum barcoo TaxID=214431 RepID=A0ACB8WPV0_9TELE|nr:hypothetical protein L3Q82_024423 [Scortum barcoo]
MSWTHFRVKRGAELSTDHHLVVSWIRWQGRKLDRPGRPKRIVFRGRLETLSPKWTMFSAYHYHVGNGGSKLWARHGLWCLSWRQTLNPVVDTGNRSQDGPGEAKTSGLGGVGEAMEEDYRWPPRREFWQTVQAPQKGKGSNSLYSANTVYSAGGELLTSTGDIVGRWMEITT